MAVGYLWDTLYGWSDTGTGGMLATSVEKCLQPIHHVAYPDTKRRFHELVQVSGQMDYLTSVKAVSAKDEDILRVHTQEHLDNIRAISNNYHGGDTGDTSTHIGNGGLEIALRAAGGTIEMTKKVVNGELNSGYSLVNPPGHHAKRNQAMGFCIFNNVSISAAYAKNVLGLDRVAIVDWDVHHGNGTQDIWWSNNSVLNISLHQNRCYPVNSGFIDERGEGKGFGYSLNVPMPAGGGDAVYLYAMENIVIPALRQYKPQLIIIASGFDASVMDPLARMMVTASGFGQLTRKILDCASEVCEGKVVFSQEGGYSPYYLPFCGLAVIEEMTGKHLTPDYYKDVVPEGGEILLAHEKESVDKIIPLLADIK